MCQTRKAFRRLHLVPEPVPRPLPPEAKFFQPRATARVLGYKRLKTRRRSRQIPAIRLRVLAPFQLPEVPSMNSKQVNVAMIGLGFGAEFIPIYQAHPNANVYAICQRNKEHLNTIGDQFKIEKRFSDFHAVLKDPNVDFVHINSPIPDHAWMSLEALKAGKHVMCTVPMATTVEECRQICELVRKTGLKYMMAETVVYSREFLFIKDLYQKG